MMENPAGQDIKPLGTKVFPRPSMSGGLPGALFKTNAVFSDPASMRHRVKGSAAPTADENSIEAIHTHPIHRIAVLLRGGPSTTPWGPGSRFLSK
jgi:hypothetical protein